ncbi:MULTISPECIES: hypothetical protein [unclassified Streptomyces]|uniref:hypothetical protein n=1 Tax=unclassified Streptomyces TaxID=2593676 RepID=UPI00037F65F0|nr:MULTISPECIES: hypothetical protein [unclassified Streptomyces]MYX38418.1 hypothetical protein [Streptomyces sp. SID8377]
MPFEDDLGAALRRTGATFSTDGGALVATAHTRGRRSRRRRTAAVAGTVAAVAAAGMTAALVVPRGDAQSTGPAAAVTDPNPGWGSETPSDRKMLALFEGLLPEGRILSGHATDTGPAADMWPRAQVLWDDGRGASTIAVDLSRATPGRDLTRCPDLTTMKQGSACTRTELANGSVLVVLKTWEYQDEREGPENWRAVLTTLDGFVIAVDEWNATEQKAEHTTRDHPPLSAAQLAALVGAPEWKRVLASFPDPSATPEEPAAGSGEVSGKEILERLKAVMPSGLKITQPVGEEGYAHVTVDDGHGATLVEVNVQHWDPERTGDLRFSNPETLPDGTLVDTEKGRGDKGGAGIRQWKADTLRPDGLRVVIAELNSGAYHRPPTRSAPALSMDQLVAAATDSRWNSLG